MFTNRQIKWSNTLSSGGNLKIGYSKSSQNLFYLILEQYPISERENIYFATKNSELRIKKTDVGVWLYDFADTKRKKIIEYNGDMYHENPSIYNENDDPHPFRKGLPSKEIWEKDRIKTLRANEEGYEVFIVWDSEYRKNPEETLKKCLNYLLN